jgi:hypothetical protein
MKFNQSSIYEAQRYAFDILTGVKPGSPYKVKAVNVTMEARLQQELPWVNTQNVFTFNFGTNAPGPTAALNNVILGENNVFVMYGIQILFGEGAANNRIYRSVNITVNDGALYNGDLSMKLESNTPIDKMQMMQFRDDGDFIQSAGMALINPYRIFSGRVATVQIIITLPTISGLVLTPNMVISTRLIGALGQA